MIEFLVRSTSIIRRTPPQSKNETWRHLEEEPHFELVPIESHGAIQIFHRRGNLTNRAELRHVVHFTLMRFVGPPLVRAEMSIRSSASDARSRLADMR